MTNGGRSIQCRNTWLKLKGSAFKISLKADVGNFCLQPVKMLHSAPLSTVHE